jgi:hypothetical protein
MRFDLKANIMQTLSRQLAPYGGGSPDKRPFFNPSSLGIARASPDSNLRIIEDNYQLE